MARDGTATRRRVVDTTISLVRQQGYAGTGLKQVAAQAGAQWSSLYHFFPGGKDELVAEALRTAGRRYEGAIDRIFTEAGDPAAGTAAFFAFAADALEASAFRDGCPIATAALEAASTSEPLREAAAEVFDFWVACSARHLEAAGVEPDRARRLAEFGLAALEGAILLSRAHRTVAPLVEGGAIVEESLRAVLPDRRSPRRRRRGRATAADV